MRLPCWPSYEMLRPVPAYRVARDQRGNVSAPMPSGVSRRAPSPARSGWLGWLGSLARLASPAWLSLGAVGAVAVCAACVQLPLPKLPVPALVERRDKTPPLPVSTFALALGMDLSLLEPLLTELLNSELPLRQADWTRVTGDGANPQVDTRMQARVAKLKLGMKDGVLRIQARVAYWGKARAQLATPFGKAWLSRGTAWGTETSPGSVLVTLALTPTLSPTFALTTRITLEQVSFTAPAGDALCGRIVIKVCVPRAQAATEVHAQLKRAIEATSPQLLAELDRRVARATDVRSLLARTLRALAHATPSIEGSSLRLAVEEVAMGALGGQGARASLPLELQLRVLFDGAEPDVARELPTRRDPQGLSTDLTFDMAVSFDRLARDLSKALTGFTQDDFRVNKLDVLGVDKLSGRLVLALSLAREQGELTVYLEAEPKLRGDRLVLSSGVRFTTGSRAALRQVQLDESALLAEFAKDQGLALRTLGDEYLEAVRVKLQAPLVLFGSLSLRSEGVPTFSDLRHARQGLVVRMHARAHSELR